MILDAITIWDNGLVGCFFYDGLEEQKFYLDETDYVSPVITVPCMFGTCPQYPGVVKSYPVYLSEYISYHSNFLQDATWLATTNGCISFNSENMTVTALGYGVAWLEAYVDGRLELTVYIYCDDVLAQLDASSRNFLYAEGSFIASISLAKYNENHKLDPLVLRTEWFLHVATMLRTGKSDDEMRSELQTRFGVHTNDIYSWEVFISELGDAADGGYSRGSVTMSLDGVKYLFDFYWFQLAAYSIATLDTVNVYTPATTQDVKIEKKYANNLCRETKEYYNSIHSSLNNISYSNLETTTAQHRNTVWASRNYTNPPYKPHTIVYKITINTETKFARLYSDHNQPNGSWIVNPNDILGLTPQQIQNKFALEHPPTHICDVTIPAGTTIYVGITNPNYGQQGLGIQYDLDWQNVQEWFSNFRPLN